LAGGHLTAMSIPEPEVRGASYGRDCSPFEVDYLDGYGVLAAARSVKVSSKSIHSSVDNPVEN
jgi:hypothetical protein